MDNVIQVRNVDKIYGKVVKTQVLFDLNIDFEKESFNSIIRQSGRGKSTLLNIIGTLDKPTNGEVFVDGKSTKDMTKNELAKLRGETLGFIFQFHYLLPEFTAIENVLMPLRVNGIKITKEKLDRANELMDFVGLEGVKDNLANNMSGGQQQRVAIARALMNNPKIILADEPTGNLDSDTTETVYELLRDINKTFKTTFIIITHDRRIAEKADRIIEIKDGKINIDIRKK